MLWLLRSMSYATLDDLCDRTLPARHPADNMHACIQASDSHMAPNRDVYGRSTAQTYSEYMADPQQTYSEYMADPQQTYSEYMADPQQTYSECTADPQQTYSEYMADPQQTYSECTADPQQTYSEYMADPQQTYSRRTVALQPTHSSLHNTYVHACMQTTVGDLVVASLVLYLLRLAPAAISWSPPL